MTNCDKCGAPLDEGYVCEHSWLTRTVQLPRRVYDIEICELCGEVRPNLWAREESAIDKDFRLHAGQDNSPGEPEKREAQDACEHEWQVIHACGSQCKKCGLRSEPGMLEAAQEGERHGSQE